MKKFEIGKTYFCRSACDYECIFEMKVISRTAKTITAEHNVGGRQIQRFKIKDHFNEGIEHVDCGRYSMHPIFSAENVR